MRAPGGRLVRLIGWLLTPLVVWAASFLGAWVGALIGRQTGSVLGGAGWLAIGGMAGGLAGLATWLWMMSRRRAAKHHLRHEARRARAAKAGVTPALEEVAPPAGVSTEPSPPAEGLSRPKPPPPPQEPAEPAPPSGREDPTG